jgi:hypothetical protein
MASVYFNANSGAQGQSVTSSASILVVNLVQQTVASCGGLWNPSLSAFVAPRPGVYRVSQTVTYSNGNGQGDGVIQGFSVNQQGPWPRSGSDLSTTNVTVLEPGRFTTETAQTVEAILQLNAGDTVQIALAGIDSSRFGLSYNSLSVNSVDGA